MFKYLYLKFKNRKVKYSIYFVKEHSVNEGAILQVLKKLQNDYYFTIIQIKIRGRHDSYRSRITIKCKKNDIANIYIDFCSALDKYIENTAYSKG